jgi:hypothetical protein
VEEEIKTKRCTGCGEEKAHTEFYKKPNSKDGLEPRCKSCKRAYHAKYYEENKIQILEKQARYDANNKEKKSSRAERYRSNNKVNIKAYAKQYNLDNKEKKNAAGKQYYLDNREELRTARKQYYLDNKEKLSAANKRWAMANPIAVRTKDANRAARKRQAGGSFSSSDISSMLQKQQCRCVYCQKDITDNYHIDHIMPVKLLGTSFIGNIQLLCPFCNISKSAKHPDQYEREIGFNRSEAQSGN